MILDLDNVTLVIWKLMIYQLKFLWYIINIYILIQLAGIQHRMMRLDL